MSGEERVLHTAIFILITANAADQHPLAFHDALDRMITFLETTDIVVAGTAGLLQKVILRADGDSEVEVKCDDRRLRELFDMPLGDAWEALRDAF